MNEFSEVLVRALAIGIGATATMDLYAMLAQRWLGIPRSNWALVGRWVGHFPRLQFAHDNMTTVAPVRGELAIGWSTHYIVGIGYALVLLALVGLEWAHQPTLLPALLVGLSMLVAPFFIMQPGMGAGIASAKTPHPNKARLRSVLNHAVFGFGLYATAHLLVLLGSS